MLTYMRQSNILDQFDRTKLIASLIFVVAALVLANLSYVYTPFILGDIVQYFVDRRENFSTLVELTLLYGGLLILGPTLDFFASYIVDNYTAKLKDTLRRKTFKDLMHHDPNQNKFGDGSMLCVWTRGLDAAINTIDAVIYRMSLPAASLIFSLSALVIGLHIHLLFVVASAVSAYGLWLVYAKRQIALKYETQNKAEETVNQLSLDLVRHRSVFQIFTQRFKLNRGFETASHDNLDANQNVLRMEMIWAIGNRIILAITLFVSLLVVINLIQHGQLQAGDIVVTAALMRNLFAPVRQINNGLRQLKTEQVRAKTLAELLELATKERALRENRKPLNKITNITIKQLGVSYDQNNIFDNLNATINIGENYYIKGRSGAGKSSLVKILSAQQKPTKGNVIFTDSKGEYHTIDTILPKLAYASQDDALFNLSLKDNVTLGIHDDIQYEKALNLAGFCDQLKQRLQKGTPLGENGAFLSGGERKRVMLARSIFHAQNLIILDETLANLDQQSAEQIITNLLNLNHISLILVSHNESFAQTSFQTIPLPA